MITRSIGKLFRGRATPFQIVSACILGAALGFMPGFKQAPGLIAVLLLLLVILNANLFLAAVIGGLSKLLSLALLPLTFSVGRFLLDGPTQGLFRWAINAPGLALFGFDYYATTGGLLLGIVLGLLAGLATSGAVSAYRRKMVALEEGSEKYKEYAGKKWVKILTFIFIGGNKGKKTYQELLEAKVGNPIRVLGVVFAVLSIILVVLIQMFAAGPIVTAALQDALEKANGATVDLAGAELDLKNNRMTLSGLAMADPNELTRDLFRAEKVQADVSGLSLLRKRLQLDQVQITGGAYGPARSVPGRRVGPAPEPTPDPGRPGDVKSIDDYIRDAKKWKERLAQARRWLEKISGPEESKAPGDKQETLEERLKREAAELGYARVRASHLVTGAPTLTITQLDAEKVRVEELPNETVDIHAKNLSTHPKLLGKAPEVVIKSSADTLDFLARVGQLDATDSTNRLYLSYRGLPADKIGNSLAISGTAPLQGGTIDVKTDGQWSSAGAGRVDLPLQVTLHNTTLSLPGLEPTPVSQFELPIGVRGPLDNPRIMIDNQELTRSLAKAGLARASDELKSKAGEKIDEELKKKVPGDAKKVLDGFLKKPQ